MRRHRSRTIKIFSLTSTRYQYGLPCSAHREAAERLDGRCHPKASSRTPQSRCQPLAIVLLLDLALCPMSGASQALTPRHVDTSPFFVHVDWAKRVPIPRCNRIKFHLSFLSTTNNTQNVDGWTLNGLLTLQKRTLGLFERMKQAAVWSETKSSVPSCPSSVSRRSGSRRRELPRTDVLNSAYGHCSNCLR